MEKELRKFIVVLHTNTGAAAVIGSDFDGMLNGLPALMCSAVDMSGSALTLVRRCPNTWSTTAARTSHQSWWFHTADIAAVFQFDGSANPVGFAPPGP